MHKKKKKHDFESIHGKRDNTPLLRHFRITHIKIIHAMRFKWILNAYNECFWWNHNDIIINIYIFKLSFRFHVRRITIKQRFVSLLLYIYVCVITIIFILQIHCYCHLTYTHRNYITRSLTGNSIVFYLVL